MTIFMPNGEVQSPQLSIIHLSFPSDKFYHLYTPHLSENLLHASQFLSNRCYYRVDGTAFSATLAIKF